MSVMQPTFTELIGLGNQVLQQALGTPTNVAIALPDFVNREYARICVELGVTRSTVTYTLVTGVSTPYYAAVVDVTTGISNYQAIVNVLYYDKYDSFPLEHRQYDDVRQSGVTGVGANINATPRYWGYDDTITGKEFVWSPILTNAQITARSPKMDITWVTMPASLGTTGGTGTPVSSFPYHLQDCIAISAAAEALRYIEEYDKADAIQKNLLDPKMKMLSMFIEERYYNKSTQRFGKKQ